MTKCGHLWAVGFDDMERASEVGEEMTRLGEAHQLVLRDVAVAVRYPDGCLTLNGEQFQEVVKAPRGGIARFLASLALGAPPLTGAAVGDMLDRHGGGSAEVGISNDFVREVARLIKPGTSVLFVLDEVGNMDAILHAIRGLGGTVLRTNVDLERANLIQSTLAAAPAQDPPR
jgi:uncharacterized membrane protein